MACMGMRLRACPRRTAPHRLIEAQAYRLHACTQARRPTYSSTGMHACMGAGGPRG